MSKIILFALATLLLVQAISGLPSFVKDVSSASSESHESHEIPVTQQNRVVREVDETPSKTDVHKEIDDALLHLQGVVGKIATNFQNNELVQNLTAGLEAFRKQVSEGGQDLVKKIQETKL